MPAPRCDECGDVAVLLDLLRPPAWHADAVCKEHPEVDFLARDAAGIEAAKDICRSGCLVRAECQTWSLAQGVDLDGVWGALSRRDRRRLLDPRRARRRRHGRSWATRERRRAAVRSLAAEGLSVGQVSARLHVHRSVVARDLALVSPGRGHNLVTDSP
ncbi:MAG: WhiB family transcriptional regulator [Acidimicrobiales bacterium]